MTIVEIPGYQIVRPIDSGGMATVYLAEQISLGRRVAIKVMSEYLNHDQTFAERFEQEARIASHLDHPNIVTIFDYGSITSHNKGTTLYLVMAFVDGQDLKTLQPKLSLVTRLKIIQDIASALNYAHDHGVIHRDIKPQNILVQKEDNRPLLTDFGIAKARQSNQSLTQTGMTLGTPQYMSPEQAQGKAVDCRADIYSLGVVLYFLLTGSVPFDGESEIAIGIKHFSDPIPELPKIFECFQSIIDKALAKTPEDRYQTAGEFANAVGQVSISNLATLVQSINDSSEAATHVMPAIRGGLQKTTKPKTNKNALILAISAGISAAVVLSGIILLNRLSSQRWIGATSSTEVQLDPTTLTNSSEAIANPPTDAVTATVRAPDANEVAVKDVTSPTAHHDQDNRLSANSYQSFNSAEIRPFCNYQLINNWGSGWQGRITLTNPSQLDISHWKVTFNLSGSTQITQSFVTNIQKKGIQLTLLPWDWNKILKADSTIELGFQGNGTAPQQLIDLQCTGEPLR
jgi:serine/threonine protein kinase